MVLVMVVLGGMGSVWGVVLGAVILQLLQSWFLQDPDRLAACLGRALGSAWLQRVDLVQSIELIFGIILVSMMLFRRQGLIPATRRTPALTLEQQTAHVGAAASPARSRHRSRDRAAEGCAQAAAVLEIAGLTGRFGGIVASRSWISPSVPDSIVARDRAERLRQDDDIQPDHRHG